MFCRDFDVVVKWNELDSVMGPPSPEAKADLDAAFGTLCDAFLAWDTKVQVAALDASARIRSQVDREMLNDMVVCLLVDHSGSMHGQKALLACASVRTAEPFLDQLGIGIEILGQTTVSWHGGRSRKAWIAAGRPANPGRLCDLLHIVYRTADERSFALRALEPMLRPDLLKENVDGEAILWAASRLHERPEPTKILVVISDGAPVDDSTLHENDEGILYDHFKSVIKELQDDGEIVLGAVGIGYSVGHLYKTAEEVDTPDDLGGALIALLEKLIVAAAARSNAGVGIGKAQ